MTQATIELDDQAIQAALHQLQHNVQHLQPALEEIGAALEAAILLNFSDQHDPDGNDWEQLSDATLARRRQGSGTGSPEILRDTGQLMTSITHNASDFAVEIGTDKAYANLQQFGGTKAQFQHLWGDIPARPFVGMSDEDKAHILDILGRRLLPSVG